MATYDTTNLVDGSVAGPSEQRSDVRVSSSLSVAQNGQVLSVGGVLIDSNSTLRLVLGVYIVLSPSCCSQKNQMAGRLQV